MFSHPVQRWLPPGGVWTLSRRVDTPELLDEGTVGAEEARRSLEDLRRLNHWLLGVRMTLRPLQRWLAATPKPTSVLDLGTGSGQMAQALALWARREHQAVRVFALDLSELHLRVAREWNQRLDASCVHLAAGDGLALPLATGSVDYITSSLFLHHFDEPSLLALFRECRRVAARGIVMSDLWRHALPYYLYKMVAEPLLVSSPVTRADSIASFHRAYRPAEIARIARQALPSVDVSLKYLGRGWLLTSRWDGPAAG